MKVIVIGVVIAAFVTMVQVPAFSASASSDACPSKPFVGSIARDEDNVNAQPSAELIGADVKRALAFDFGSARNTTVYLATYALDQRELGSTIEAPPGETLVAIFLRPKTGDLEPGKRLKTPRDSVTAIVDTGGGAQASTGEVRARARILEFSDTEVCFTIDYRSDLQRVKGRVRANVG